MFLNSMKSIYFFQKSFLILFENMIFVLNLKDGNIQVYLSMTVHPVLSFMIFGWIQCC